MGTRRSRGWLAVDRARTGCGRTTRCGCGWFFGRASRRLTGSIGQRNGLFGLAAEEPQPPHHQNNDHRQDCPVPHITAHGRLPSNVFSATVKFWRRPVCDRARAVQLWTIQPRLTDRWSTAAAERLTRAALPSRQASAPSACPSVGHSSTVASVRRAAASGQAELLLRCGPKTRMRARPPCCAAIWIIHGPQRGQNLVPWPSQRHFPCGSRP